MSRNAPSGASAGRHPALMMTGTNSERNYEITSLTHFYVIRFYNPSTGEKRRAEVKADA